ncbi:MAG: hypothetical protein Q7T63_01465, partial [Burkholderiaceae bacterium]|nr:hypothetical protein [Burkholderiaceae bacterium]
IVKVAHRGLTCRLHSVKPTRQTVSGRATGAQAHCPAHGERGKYRSPALSGRNPRGRDSRFHPVSVLPETRQAPNVEAHAGTADRVQIGSLRHQVQPTADAIRKGLRLIRQVLGVTAIHKGGQVHLRPWPSRQAPHRPSNPCQGGGVVMNSRQAQGDPERQSIPLNAIACEPAQVDRFDQGEPMAPAFRPPPQPLVQPTEPTCDTGEPSGVVRLGFAPILENCSLAGFGPRAGRQIVGLAFDRTGQEPMSLFLHDFTAWFSHDFRKVPPEVARVSALRFQFHYGLQ